MMDHYIPIKHLKILLQSLVILDGIFYVYVLRLQHYIHVYENDLDLLMLSKEFKKTNSKSLRKMTYSKCNKIIPK
jgi:hypothetical protein